MTCPTCGWIFNMHCDDCCKRQSDEDDEQRLRNFKASEEEE